MHVLILIILSLIIILLFIASYVAVSWCIAQPKLARQYRAKHEDHEAQMAKIRREIERKDF